MGLLALASPVAVACGTTQAGGSEGSSAAVPAGTDQVDGVGTAFVVPTGTVTVTVGQPVAEVSGAEAQDGDARTAPEGSSYLPVHLDLDQTTAPWGGILAGPPQPAEVVVVVDGESRPVGSPYATDGPGLALAPVRTYYVPVPGTPEVDDVTVGVSYDGATQDARPGSEPTGRGAALAALPAQRPAAADCPPEGWSTDPSTTVEVLCDVPVAGRTPYWPGSGWAPDGADWTVLDVERLEVTSVSDPGGGAYEVESAQGAGVLAELGAGGYGPTSLAGTVVLEDGQLADDGSVPLEVDLRATPPGATDPVPLRASYAVRVG